MQSIYNKATVCPFENKNCAESSPDRLTLDPHISDRFTKSRNYEELKYLWIEWHKQSGKLMRNDYKEYVELMNKVAVGNGYKDASEYWQVDFEDPNFEKNVDDLWLAVKPLYDELHKYMRRKLIDIYGKYVNSINSNRFI